MEDDLQVPPGTTGAGAATPTAAEVLLACAMEEARRRRRPLTLVHGVEPPVTAWVEVGSQDLREVLNTLIAAGRELLDRAEARVLELASEVDTYEVLRLATPHDALLALAPDAQPVVVSPRCADAGSAPLPTQEFGPRPDRALGTVVLCDGSPASRVTLTRAWRFAYLRGQSLTVLLCLPDPPEVGPATDIGLMDATARMAEDLGPSRLGFERKLLADLVAELRGVWPAVDARLVVDDDGVDDCLSRVPTDAEMLVAGPPHARRAAEVLGGPATRDDGCVMVILPVGEPVVDADVPRPTDPTPDRRRMRPDRFGSGYDAP